MDDNDRTLGEISRSLTRLEGKVDLTLSDHEFRLRRAEKWTYALPPALVLAVASAVAAVVGAVAQ